jgi:hypothetical protein
MSDDRLPDVQGLIELARADVPSDDERARVKRSVLGRVAGSAAVAVASSAATSVSAASVSNAAAGAGANLVATTASTSVAAVAGTKLGSLLGIVLSVAIGASAAVGVIAVRQRAASRGDAVATVVGVSSAPKPLPTSELGSPPVEEPVLAAEVVAPSPPRSLGAPAASTALPSGRAAATGSVHRVDGQFSSTLEAELPLLREAQEALHTGDAARALARLNELAKRFPNGALAEEREAAHAIAACRLDGRRESGGRGEGLAEAQAFARIHTASPLADRVREACALDRPASHD